MAKKKSIKKAGKLVQKKQPAKQPANYFKRIFQIYINSFKDLNNDYFFYVFFDLLFLVFVSLVSYLAGIILTKYTGSLAAFQAMDSVDIQYLTQLKSVIGTIFFVMIVTVLLFIAGWSLAKTFIYNRIYKNKFNWKVFLKFFLSNLGIGIIFVIIMATMPTFVLQSKVPIFGLIVMLVLGYLITIFYILFFKLRKFGKTFSATAYTAVMRIHKYFLPFLICTLTVLIVLGIFSTIIFNISSGTIANIISAIFLLFVIAWARLYLIKIVEYIGYG